ncbi:MarR family winged helix-turn-helix transcriptional regulator [Sulfurospirillum halorespirans]|jgi:MarR family 2-MHQ and catechol resistance regulon transcriptional repressor|uniref:Transcriptional regulator, MarR family n=1 Tax=Sulfurospirillum halorespirans DSM 13726 TaxID=1193502 RepID=A0A1D7TN93_9BACT|nr:MarR family transcriptional regulator [Sulfurospirillum halorespirans]AOO66455.1 transcriptional regulator, MarR family [Sulfurospirillum halorespirans DSM 13726]
MKLRSNVKSYGERTDRSMQVWIQILRAFQKIRAKELKYINASGLSMNQFEILEVLYHRGDLQIGAITKLIESTPGNVTVVVKNLVRDGFIQTLPCSEDSRVRIVSITESGRELIESMFPQHASNLQSYFEVLSDEELIVLYDLLRKLQKAQ